MKTQDFGRVKKKFEETQLPILVIGKEEGAKKILSLWSGPVTTFNAENFCSKKFSEEMETLPFLEKKRFIFVSGADALKTEEIETILQVLERANEWSILLLFATTLSANSKLVKRVDEVGVVWQMGELKSWEREKECVSELIHTAKQEGVHLDQLAAKKIVEGCEEGFLMQELQRLICFVGEKKVITVEDVNATTSFRAKQTLWQLGEAIFRLDLIASLQLGKNLLEESQILPLIAHLRTQVRSALQMTSELEKGGPEGLQRAFPYLKGTLLDKKISSLKNYGERRLKLALLHLMDAEVGAKSSSASPELLLELLLIKLCRSTFCPTP